MSFYSSSPQIGKTNIKQRKFIEANVLSDAVYLSAVALYILKASFGTTLLYIPWPAGYDNAFRLLASIAILLKASHIREYQWNKTVTGVLIFIFIAFKNSWISTCYDFLLNTALLIVGARGTSYKKILKIGFWINLCVLSLAMLGSFTSGISDLIYIDEGVLKHSFGIVYPTDFASHIAFLFLMGWILYGDATGIISAICAVGLCIYVYHYTGAKCSTIVLALSAVGVLYVSLTEKYRERISVVQHLAKWANKGSIYAVPLCTLIMILLTILYNAENSIMVGINSFLTGRLSLGKRAIDEYGIKLFGTAFPQIGFGGTTAWSWASEYKFVDCSYVLILVRYGVMVLIAVCIMSVYMGKKAAEYKQWRLLVAVTLTAIHSMIEHHFPEAEYNLFLLLPFAAYDVVDADREKNPSLMGNKRYATYAVEVCISLLMVTLLPRFVTYMKTIVSIFQFNTYENRISYVVIMAGCILWFFLVMRLLFKGISAFITKQSLPRTVPIRLGVLLFVFVLSMLWSENILYQHQHEYKGEIEANCSTIELLLTNDCGKLYVDHVPEFYKRDFKGISDNLLSAEGLADRNNSTLIAKDEGELRVLISEGYEYGQLASGNAVYTNSKKAKKLLEETGIELTEYYSKKRFVDLNTAARQNNLEMTEEGRLLLSGKPERFWHGPGTTIYKGTLQVWYTFRLVSAVGTEGDAAVVSIYSDQRQHLWKQEVICLDDFSQDGMLSYTLECSLPFDCPYIEFMLSVPDGVILEVQEISYGKVN